eukprot:gene19824-6964_t
MTLIREPTHKTFPVRIRPMLKSAPFVCQEAPRPRKTLHKTAHLWTCLPLQMFCEGVP